MDMGLFDFSIGANIILSAIIGCQLATTFELGYFGLIAGSIATGALVGLCNGYFYVKLRIPSMIVTAGLALIYESVANYMAGGVEQTLPSSLRAFGSMPGNIILAFITFIIAYGILNYTKFGTYTYAIGSDEFVAKNMGATGFIEDYTYDLTQGKELELASHMLEVPVTFAATKPEIHVMPLGIGGKEDPARLIFDGVEGDGIQVTMVDMGDHYRIICADIELVKQPKPMPNLPVARIMYRHKPNFKIGTEGWCIAGGAHHSVVSTALTRDDIALFAMLTGTELICIGEETTKADLNALMMKKY